MGREEVQALVELVQVELRDTVVVTLMGYNHVASIVWRLFAEISQCTGEWNSQRNARVMVDRIGAAVREILQPENA